MRYFLLLFTIFVTVIPFARPGENLRIPYSKDFVFKEGIYTSFIQFRQNSPKFDNDFRICEDHALDNFINLFTREKLEYHDSSGTRRIDKDVWGYSKGNKVYINLGGRFHRIFTNIQSKKSSIYHGF